MFEPKKPLPDFVTKENRQRAAGVPVDVNVFKPRARAILDKRQTDSDKPDSNPFDTSPRTEAEAIEQLRVQAALEGMAMALQKSRPWITLEMLSQMTAVQAHLEGELPELDGKRHGIYLFSLSGTVDGHKVERVLLGGHCIIISADNPAAARAIAQEGLQDTIEHANRYAFAKEMGVDLTPENPGISIDTEFRPKR